MHVHDHSRSCLATVDTPNIHVHEHSRSCRATVDTPNMHVHEHSRSCLATGTLINSGWAKLALMYSIYHFYSNS